MMRRLTCLLLALVVFLAVPTGPAWAWGPRAQLAMVNTAIRLISRDGKIPLSKLQKDIQDGAAVSSAMLKELMPGIDIDAVAAIRAEMYLLQAVYSGRVDPYFAFRLGVLGKAVARVTAPLAKANPTYRDLYYADVERNIERTGVEPSSRLNVDPEAYLTRVQREASAQEELILKDYESGLGFQGVAKATLPMDASRSIDAIADVWYSILQTPVTVTNLSQSQVREYVINALEFYIRRGNLAEIDSAYDRLEALGAQTPELRKRIGDMFFEAKRYERAMDEYRAVLVTEPGRRDVIERMAEFYVGVGDEALRNNLLEGALEAYTTAGNIDMVSTTALEKKLQTQGLIEARDERLDAARKAILNARELESKSDRQAVQRRYNEAKVLLQQAKSAYGSVGNEFPEEAREASAALTRLGVRMKQLNREVFESAKELSGSGQEGETRRLAREAAQEVNEEALRAMMEQEHEAFVEELREELREKLIVKPSVP